MAPTAHTRELLYESTHTRIVDIDLWWTSSPSARMICRHLDLSPEHDGSCITSQALEPWHMGQLSPLARLPEHSQFRVVVPSLLDRLGVRVCGHHELRRPRHPRSRTSIQRMPTSRTGSTESAARVPTLSEVPVRAHPGRDAGYVHPLPCPSLDASRWFVNEENDHKNSSFHAVVGFDPGTITGISRRRVSLVGSFLAVQVGPRLAQAPVIDPWRHPFHPPPPPWCTPGALELGPWRNSFIADFSLWHTLLPPLILFFRTPCVPPAPKLRSLACTQPRLRRMSMTRG